MIIAIDGPSGAGKGTVARAVSEKLGYRHIDTGAMYRAVGWKALHDGAVARRRGGAGGAGRARRAGGRGRRGGRGRPRRHAGDPNPRDGQDRGGGGAAAPGARGAGGAAARDWRARRRGDGGPGHRHRGVPGRAGEGLPGCFRRRARPPAGQRHRPFGRRRRAGRRRGGAGRPGPVGHDAHGVAADGGAGRGGDRHDRRAGGRGGARVLDLVQRTACGAADAAARRRPSVQRSSKSSDEAGSNSQRCRSRSTILSAPSSSSLSSYATPTATPMSSTTFWSGVGLSPPGASSPTL